MLMSTKLPEVDLIDITFDEVEDSFGNSFCNSRLALDREVNLLDKEVCPAPVVQKASTEIYYVHQVRCLLSLPLLNNVLNQHHYYKLPGPGPSYASNYGGYR